MKIIFLNIWGGKLYEPLAAFVRHQADTTDFFCFQEMFDAPRIMPTVYDYRTTILHDLTYLLPDFTPYFAPAVRGFDGDAPADPDLSLGIAVFVRKGIEVAGEGSIMIAGEARSGATEDRGFPHNLQYVRFLHGAVPYTLAHLHGVPSPGSKRDTPVRIAQSQKILDLLAGEKGEKIFGGDFNLMPDTESVRMLERAGYRNLVAEYGVTSTRNRFSYGQYPEHDRQYFADYAFVSPGVAVKDFTVPSEEVSDHLPLILTVA